MKAHLIGAGGIGMSGIATLLLARGEKVSGSDSADNPLLQRMNRMGAQVQIGHSEAHINHPDIVVYSSSISPQNPELVAARNRKIPILHRGQMVARLVADKQTIAVTGAHGKSTTSGMAAQLLLAAGLDPTVVLGAELEAIGGNAGTLIRAPLMTMGMLVPESTERYVSFQMIAIHRLDVKLRTVCSRFAGTGGIDRGSMCAVGA